MIGLDASAGAKGRLSDTTGAAARDIRGGYRGPSSIPGDLRAVHQRTDKPGTNHPWITRLRIAANPPMALASLRVAFVVGLVLNAVNEGPAWWSGQPVSPYRLGMNFLVPFLVSSYSAADQALRASRIRSNSDAGASTSS